MRYDVVPIRAVPYRGIDRAITGAEFNTKKAKRQFKGLLAKYFDYLSVSEQPYCRENFEKVVSFYHLLKENDIRCEMIAYGKDPMENAYGYKTVFLGIDIVLDMCESFIFDCISESDGKVLLNSNGLSENIDDAARLIALYKHDGFILEPCWVYKIEC